MPRIQITSVQLAATGVLSVSLSVDGVAATFTVLVPILPGETAEELKERVLGMVREEFIRRDSVARRRNRYTESLPNIEVTVQRPGPVAFTFLAGVLSGSIGLNTAKVIVALAQGSVTREVLIHPNKDNRFSVDVGSWLPASLIAVSGDGIYGAEQAVP